MPSLEHNLLSWFSSVRRPLPWRITPSPYRVWISEIMLQQTRVETVINYFQRFVDELPTVNDLASASIDRVLKLWEGLGYYSRARNLHAAAKIIADSNQFPQDSKAWSKLPGIGPYTAAAIASICNNEPIPVVDGNVLRVTARLRALPIDPKDPSTRIPAAQWLQPYIEQSNAPGDFNEALMELGETLCLPASANCKSCPLTPFCIAFQLGTPTLFPAKSQPKERPTRYYIAFLVQQNEKILLTQRPAKGLLGGLWELPMVQLSSAPKNDLPSPSTIKKAALSLGISASEFVPSPPVTHIFTHFRQILFPFIPSSPSIKNPSLVFAEPSTLALATASAKTIRTATIRNSTGGQG